MKCSKMFPFKISCPTFYFFFDYKSLPPRISFEHAEANRTENDLVGPIGDDTPEYETEMKVLTIQQYTRLVQLIPQVETLKEKIGDMTAMIEKKDNEIDELKNYFSKLRPVRIICY